MKHPDTPRFSPLRASCLRSIIATLLLVGVLPSFAQIVVGPAEPIRHEVHVHRIQTTTEDGFPAVAMGDAEQEAEVISLINQIWAQAGVRIVFSPITQWASDFAFEGDLSVDPRPADDLRLIDLDPAAPKTTVATDIEMYFVERLPGKSFLSDTQISGLASLDSTRVAIVVGADVIFGDQGNDALEALAFVLAHEIGHCLGLPHLDDGPQNLMTDDRTTEVILEGQKTRIFSNGGGIDGFEILVPINPIDNYQDFVTANGIMGGPEDDDDGDGVLNLMEFALDTDPKVASGVPPLTPTGNGDEVEWAIPIRRTVLEDGYNYLVEISDDLDGFVPVVIDGDPMTTFSSDGLVMRTQFTGDQTRFLRLQVE